jgi:hypothetical protein
LAIPQHYLEAKILDYSFRDVPSMAAAIQELDQASRFADSNRFLQRLRTAPCRVNPLR